MNFSFSEETAVDSLKALTPNEEEKSALTLKSLDELLQQIKKDQVSQRPELRRREARFLKDRDQQKALLKQALLDLKKEEQLLKFLQETFEKQDQELSQLEEKLALTMGALGELFGVVKQTAGETKALFENSVISGQYKNRTDLIKKISAKTNLPNISDLEMLWFLVQQEMTESGKVVQFQEEVIKANGKTESQLVTRVGSFHLVSRGKYLVYDKETGRLSELARQPHRRFLSLIRKFEKSRKDITAFGIDPSRGSFAFFIDTDAKPPGKNISGGLYSLYYSFLVALWFGFIFSKILSSQGTE